MHRVTHQNRPAMVLFSLVLTSSSLASLAIQNYDHDPDLAAALEYDRGETTDPSKANRELAEKYYLEYLKKDIPSFQKARVYLRLGVLYTVATDPRKGLLPDDAKGNRYLEKVLQLEPERIDAQTVRARTLLASAPGRSPEEYVRKHLEVYEWLSSLNEEKFQRLWLPLEPNQTAILPISLQSLRNLVPNVKVSAATNLLAEVDCLTDRETWLAEIIRRFPHSEIADMAQRVRNVPPGEGGHELIEYQRSRRPQPLAAASVPDTPISSQIGPQARGAAQGQSTPSDRKQSGTASVLADTSKPVGGTRAAWLVCPLIIGAVLGGGLVFYLTRRKDSPEGNHRP